MSETDIKEKRSYRRKRNIYAKILRESREFLPKIKRSKPKNTRKKIRVTEIEEYMDGDT